ncbi:UvrB/UvrC motif-containing protein [Salirhabdus sp. Marseille-P4669]|uniref:UvrB/UvrC motif-containing protein n=1 Tax=Salirhabdus sp. Marseille-P4669 TaxID=2042310 RepID=UPI000C7D8B30|nr:UvrB/UvrC motif-containing protein [Salirhabdus sp. Marseille-P4669]
MECQECHNRPATVHFTQIINGNKTEVHLCEQCAQDKGYMDHNKQSFTFHNLLSGLFNFDSTHPLGGTQSTDYTSPKEQLKCESCGMTYQQFANVGKFGCAECYKTFNDRLNPIFRKVHSGNTKHEGKIPKRQGGSLHVKRNIEMLRYKLQQMIESEKFEEAAKLRDEIKNLEKQISGDKGGEA